MSFFDLLFLTLALAFLISLGAACGLGISGNRLSARRILNRLAICTAVYFVAVICVSAVAPRRIYRLGQKQCFDDWCITADSFEREAAGATAKYVVNLHISSRARRITQRERNLSVFLTDSKNRRYDAVSTPTDVSIATFLGPGDSVAIQRHFIVPLSVQDVNLAIAHEGGFPIGWLIIGYDTWFRRPPLVRLAS